LNQRASAREGALSVLCGIAATESVRQGRPVRLEELGVLGPHQERRVA
jgi:hypothetical protein